MRKLKDLPDNTFTAGINFYKLFWFFMIGSVIGFIYENVLGVMQHGYFVLHQGLMYGPFIPVYGIGAVALILCLFKLKNPVLIFLIGAVLGGAVEYVSSLVQQYVFGSVSWNYSHIPLNIGGRTDIFFMLFWGVLGLLMMKIIYPKFSFLIDKIPDKPGRIITWVLIVFMILNIVISGLAVFRMYQRHEKIPATNFVERYFDRYFPNSRVAKIYGNMVFEGRPDSLSIDASSSPAPRRQRYTTDRGVDAVVDAKIGPYQYNRPAP